MVSKERHVINGKEVRVKLYFDCLVPGGGTDRPKTESAPKTDAVKEEEERTSTVEVTVGELQSKKIYQRFFEDPRNGGGEVKDIQITTDEVVLVTFVKASGTRKSLSLSVFLSQSLSVFLSLCLSLSLCLCLSLSLSVRVYVCMYVCVCACVWVCIMV